MPYPIDCNIENVDNDAPNNDDGNKINKMYVLTASLNKTHILC